VDFERTSTVTDLDLNAVSGTIGAMYHAAPFQLGLALHLPEQFDVDGQTTEDVRRYEVAGDTLDYYDEYAFEDEIELPFRTSLGVAFSPELRTGDLTLSAQWDYADWEEIDYAAPCAPRTASTSIAPPTTSASAPSSPSTAYRSACAPASSTAGCVPLCRDRRLHRGRGGCRLRRGAALLHSGGRSPARSDLRDRFRLLERILPPFGGGGSPVLGEEQGAITEEEVQDRRILLGATFRI